MIVSAEIITAGLLNAMIQLGVWLWIRRWVERRDKLVDELQGEVKDLRDEKLKTLATQVEASAEKRKAIYERIEKVELAYMTKEDCQKAHKAIGEQQDKFHAAVLKLERVSVETDRLVRWLDDVTKEQISLGKDQAATTARLESLEHRAEGHR